MITINKRCPQCSDNDWKQIPLTFDWPRPMYLLGLHLVIILAGSFHGKWGGRNKQSYKYLENEMVTSCQKIGDLVSQVEFLQLHVLPAMKRLNLDWWILSQEQAWVSQVNLPESCSTEINRVKKKNSGWGSHGNKQYLIVGKQ